MDMFGLKMYPIPSESIVSKVNTTQCIHFKIVKSSYDLIVDVGEIQFIKKELLVAPNSYEIEVAVERSHVVKEKVEVKWKLVSDDHFHLSNGTVYFIDENDLKVIRLDLKNANINLSTKIELYEPSNGYQIGENKVANISFVCKFLFEQEYHQI